MLLEQSLGALLELLRTDFFRSHALWNDERAAGDLPEPLCKALCVDDEVEVALQVNGKVRAKLVIAVDLNKEEIEKMALTNEKVSSEIEGKTVRKVIVVPNRMVNIVVS